MFVDAVHRKFASESSGLHDATRWRQIHGRSAVYRLPDTRNAEIMHSKQLSEPVATATDLTHHERRN